MKPNFLVLNLDKEDGTSEILIHGPIGESFWSDDGVKGKDFTDALNKIPAGRKITIGINSEGGSIGEGLAIYNAIQRRSADITARIDGYALSIASVFPLAAAKVTSPDTAIWMIHNAWVWSKGNADQLRKDADMLDKHDDALVSAYVKKTGKSEKEIRKAMSEETWFTGKEAKDWGLCDECTDAEASLASLDFTNAPAGAFRNMPVYAMAAHFRDKTPSRSELDAVFQFASQETRDWVKNDMIKLFSAAVAAGNHNQNNTMNKKLIVALLKKHGIEAAETETEAELDAKLQTIPLPKAPTDSADATLNQIIDLRAQLLTEKQVRITEKVKAAAENKIENDKLAWWVKLAMNDEAGTLAQINALPVKQVGADPIGQISIINEGRVDEIMKLPTAKERHSALLKDWDNLIQDAYSRDARGEKVKAYPRHVAKPVAGYQFLPQNTNTFSATITTSFLLDGAITNLQHRLAPLLAFARDFSTDPYKPKATHVLKNVTATGAVVTDGTNFEQGGDTVGAVSVTMHQYSKPFSVTNDQLNSGFRLNDLVNINSLGFAAALMEIVNALITEANFSTHAAIVSAFAAFGFTDLADAWGKLQKSPIKNVILDGRYLARVINQPTFYQVAGNDSGNGWKAFGWDFIGLNTDWTSAGAAIAGLACNPQAIAAVSGLPLTPPQGIPGNTLQVMTETVPGLNFTIAAYSWFALQSRTAWMSYDSMFGANVADTTAGVVIKTS